MYTIIALALIGAIAVIVFFSIRQKPHAGLQPKQKLSYYIAEDVRDSHKIIQHLLDIFSENFEVSQADSTSRADVIIATKYADSLEVATTKQTGRPKQLNSPQFILSDNVPDLYIGYSTDRVSLAQKEKVKSALESLRSKAVNWSMNVAGDIIIGRTVYEQEVRRNDYTSSFHKVRALLESADYTIANAEWTAADGISYPLSGLSFASPAKSLDGLSYAGIDAVSLANNHSMNGGVEAFEQMLKNIQAHKIGYFGAGKNFNEAHAPYVATIKGVKVALLGYTAIPGNVEAGQNSTGNSFIKIAPWYPFTESYVAQMETDIKSAKTRADVVIPFFHWSEEYTHVANDQMRQVAHRAIDAGANMVLGSHPHWVQGIEWYKDRLISYSLGNFIFDQEQSLKTKQGVVLNTEWAGSELIGAKFTPIQIEQYYQPRILEQIPAQSVLNDIYQNSWWPY